MSAGGGTYPADIAVMRQTAQLLLEPDGDPAVMPPTTAELATLTAMMRWQLAVIVPAVEDAAKQLPENSISRYTALGCVWEARSRLEAEPQPRTGGAAGHARRLAGVLDALCGQLEQLGGGV